MHCELPSAPCHTSCTTGSAIEVINSDFAPVTVSAFRAPEDQKYSPVDLPSEALFLRPNRGKVDAVSSSPF